MEIEVTRIREDCVFSEFGVDEVDVTLRIDGEEYEFTMNVFDVLVIASKPELKKHTAGGRNA